MFSFSERDRTPGSATHAYRGKFLIGGFGPAANKAESIGYHPQVILAGRRLEVDGANILVLGLAFKKNCPDLRKTKVVDVISELAGIVLNRRFRKNQWIFDTVKAVTSQISRSGCPLACS